MLGMQYSCGYQIAQGEWRAVQRWCNDIAGPDDWFYDGWAFWFRYPEHLMLFKLRWN